MNPQALRAIAARMHAIIADPDLSVEALLTEVRRLEAQIEGLEEGLFEEVVS